MRKNSTIAKQWPATIVTAFLFVSGSVSVSADTSSKQAELDTACERAREAKLAPMRDKYVEECVNKKQKPDRKSCEAFYADFGAQSGNRAPLFYDLPECVEAFEFRQGNRSR